MYDDDVDDDDDGIFVVADVQVKGWGVSFVTEYRYDDDGVA
jgi:hypothetical protein